MAVRRTAYLTDTQPVDERDPDSGVVTVDLYVLWPEGHDKEAALRVQAALCRVEHEILDAS